MELTDKHVQLRPCTIEIIEKMMKFTNESFDNILNELVLYHFFMVMNLEENETKEISLKEFHQYSYGD